jgi:hypothetical protein
MDKRQFQNKERKRKEKYILNREQKYSAKVFVFFMIVSILNGVFWHDQFLGLDFNYKLIFVIIPIGLGVFLYWKTNKIFIKDLQNTKPSGLKDIILSSVFLLLIGVFFAYISSVTLANAIFKIGMDFSINNKPEISKTYSIESTYRNNRGRGVNLFSTVYYFDDENKIKGFDVRVNEVKTSREKRKIIFKCKEGFWNYYKIIDYKIE